MSSEIQYRTEAALHLDCIESTSRPVAVKWVKGAGVVNLHAGGEHIVLSRAQVLQLASFAPAIAADLEEMK
jgi:hypothetical protein